MTNAVCASTNTTTIDQHCGALGDNLNDGPESVAFVNNEIADAFWKGDDTLKRYVDEWRDLNCTLDDGRPRLSNLRLGYYQAFERENDWSKSLAQIEYLKKRFPNADFVALAEARYWIAYAWNARGEGDAASITQEGARLMHERMEKAEKVLINSKHYADNLPVWYDEMITVQSALNRPEDERDKIFVEGVRKFPTYYPIYFTMEEFLTPKWGGSWETIDNLVKWSVKNSIKTDGNSMYARLYWAADGDEGVRLFKDTHASWSKMKLGFEDLMVRHPKSKWNLNNFAKFACMAGDKKTFLTLRQQIGSNVMDAAWQGNTSLDLCETKFGLAQ